MSSGEGTAGPGRIAGHGADGGTGDPGDGNEKTVAGEPETAAEIEADIESVRRQMSDVAGELQRRGHRVAEVSRRWAWRLMPIAGGLMVLAAAGLGYRYWRSRRRGVAPDRWLASLQSVKPGQALDDLRTRVSKAIAPARASRPHRLRDAGFKIGTAALGAAASVAGKQLAGKLIGSDSRRRS